MNKIDTLNNMISYNFANYVAKDKDKLRSIAKEAILELNVDFKTKVFSELSEDEKIELFRNIRNGSIYDSYSEPDNYKALLFSLIKDVELELINEGQSKLRYEEMAYILKKLN